MIAHEKDEAPIVAASTTGASVNNDVHSGTHLSFLHSRHATILAHPADVLDMFTGGGDMVMAVIGR